MMSNPRFSLALLCFCLVLARGGNASSQPLDEVSTVPLRAERRLLISASFPDDLFIAGKDATAPLPGLRVAINVSRRLALGLSAGLLPHDTFGRWTIIHGDVRYYLLEKGWSPYVLAGAGVWSDKADEGADHSYPFLFGGAGLEYAGQSGFTVWAELAPALVGYSEGSSRSAAAGLYGGFGLGYRVRTSH